MTEPLTIKLRDDSTSFEIKIKNVKYSYKIPEYLILVNRKMVRIFYSDDENFEPSKIQIFDERGNLIYEDRKYM